jgi:hypothetical protein
MPWREVSALDQRREFVRLAVQDGVNRRELCRRFGISPDVGYKWLARHMAGDADALVRSVSTTKAYVSFKGRLWKVPQAFCGERLAIRPLNVDGKYGVFFAAHQVAAIDLTGPQSVRHVSEQL